MANYPFNETVRLSTTFAQAGVNYDPALVVCKVASPTGIKTVYTYGTDAALQKDGTGLYHLDIVPVQSGVWSYRWEGTTGLISAASETTLFVEPTVF